LRSVKPEATIAVAAGKKIPIGGLGFKNMASGYKGQAGSKFVADYFLEDWLADMVNVPNSYRIVSKELRAKLPQTEAVKE